MTKILSGLGTLFLLSIALLLGKQLLAGTTEAGTDSGRDKELAELALSINSSLPMMIDADTRADSAVGGPGPKLTYFLTLPSYKSTEVDPKEVEARFPQFKAHICSSDMSKLVKTGVDLHYVYRGNDGKEISRLVVTPPDCGVSS